MICGVIHGGDLQCVHEDFALNKSKVTKSFHTTSALRLLFCAWQTAATERPRQNPRGIFGRQVSKDAPKICSVMNVNDDAILIISVFYCIRRLSPVKRTRVSCAQNYSFACTQTKKRVCPNEKTGADRRKGWCRPTIDLMRRKRINHEREQAAGCGCPYKPKWRSTWIIGKKSYICRTNYPLNSLTHDEFSERQAESRFRLSAAH